MRTFRQLAVSLGLIAVLVAGCSPDSPEARFADSVGAAIEQYGQDLDLSPDKLIAEAKLACQSATAETYRAASEQDIAPELAKAIFDAAHEAGLCT